MSQVDLDLLTSAVREAGKIAQGYFRAAPDWWNKSSDQSPVSVADIAVNDFLHARLLSVYPEYGWLSEETQDNAARLCCDKIFIVDPIDGTRAFLNGSEYFAISIAIAEQGVVSSGVVYLPAKGLLYRAYKGGGAWLNDYRIFHSDCKDIGCAQILTSRSQLKSKYWRQSPPLRVHFRPSLAYRLCLVADGRYDGMVNLWPTWEWDVAAGDLICHEAGILPCTRKNKTPIYNSIDAQIDGFLAATPAVQKQLISYL